MFVREIASAQGKTGVFELFFLVRRAVYLWVRIFIYICVEGGGGKLGNTVKYSFWY